MLSTDLKAVLFDLDGTFLDTAPDLAAALNELLQNYQHPPLPFSQIRPMASHGARGLLQLGFNVTENDTQYPALQQQFLTLYKKHLTKQTKPFAGIEALLLALTQQKLQWGIVTNKPAVFTQPLMTHLGFLEKAACIVSGDTLEKRKPHPEPLWHACELLTCSPAQCIYIGDAQRDIEAGKRAGMHTIVALYGYIHADDKPEEWGADHYVRSVAEIIEFIDQLVTYNANEQ